MTITKRILDKAFQLIILADRMKDIYGDCFVEFGERSIEVLDPLNLTIKNGKIIHAKRVSDKNLYGIRIMESFFPLTFEQAIKEMELNLQYQLGNNYWIGVDYARETQWE